MNLSPLGDCAALKQGNNVGGFNISMCCTTIQNQDHKVRQTMQENVIQWFIICKKANQEHVPCLSRQTTIYRILPNHLVEAILRENNVF